MKEMQCGRRCAARLALVALICAWVGLVLTASQAAYPERPIKIIVPFAPGGANDLTARILAVPFGQALGQTVIIENRGGANGNIGIAATARAEADGYTLLVSSNVLEVNPLLTKQPAYDALKDFAPLTDIVSAPNVIAARPDTGLKTFADLLTRARAHPTELNFATPGAGSISHLGAELLKIRAGIGMVHVPFTGAGPAMQAVLGGTVQLIGVTVSTAVPQVKAGKLVALVQTGKERWSDLPDVPTLAEAGIQNANSETYQSLFAPAGVPQQILDRIAKAAVESLRRPEVREQYRKVNLRVLGSGPRAMRERLEEAVKTWKEVIARSGIQAK